MLVLKYLSGNRRVEKLAEDYAIKINRHDDGRVILNYNQIESPKTESLVRECRGLVLHEDDVSIGGQVYPRGYKLVARAFSRFFNWGEYVTEMNQFDFSEFMVQEKVDGSLLLLYYWSGDWHINTRGSFGDGNVGIFDLTFRDLFNRVKLDFDKLDTELCYVCELVSPENKVVRTYKKTALYLLSTFRKDVEESHESTEQWYQYGFHRPEIFNFYSMGEIENFLEDKAESDPTYEGVVIRDRNNLRFKIKNPAYFALHQMRGNGDNLYKPKYLLDFILRGEVDELLSYFPEVHEHVRRYEARCQKMLDELQELWYVHGNEQYQKNFALAVKHHPLSSILFRVRKSGESVDKVFRDSKELVLKRVFYNDV